MQAEFNHKKLNCIQVKGMNNLSIPYIKRFFSHVGYVEDVKKSNDRVIVRFRFASSLNKAYRFNGRILDKDPLRIRNLSTSTPAEQLPSKKHCKQHSIRQINDKISDRIKYGPLDIPYHWMKVERILGNIEDDELRWLVYELFIQKLIKIFTLYITGFNARSKYYEYVLMEMILIHKNKPSALSGSQNSSTQKLEFTSSMPRDLQYETTFESWNNQLENRIRHRFISMRTEGQGMTLYYLYMLFYKNSLKLQQDIKLLSDKEQPESLSKMKKITINQITKLKYEVCIEDWMPKLAERSEYRCIDVEHPSKEIQVFSDSYFHEGPSSAVVFQIILDDFDGCINNSHAQNIFHEFRPFFTPNCLLIKHTDSRKNSYDRLFYELRLLNCSSETIQNKQYLKMYTLKTDSQRLPTQTQGKEEEFETEIEQIFKISQIKMQKHNLVMGYWESPQQFLYNIEGYLDYYCGSNEAETDSEYTRELSVFVICSNSQASESAKINELIKAWKSSEKIIKSKATLYFLYIYDVSKFEKQKVRHYLQQQVDNLIKSPMNIDIARMRAKQFLMESPDKFQGIQEPQKFITTTIWQLYEQRGKRNVRNEIMEYSYKARQ